MVKNQQLQEEESNEEYNYSDQNDDLLDSEQESDDKHQQKWGTNKNKYYKQGEDSDEEDEFIEEEEIKRKMEDQNIDLEDVYVQDDTKYQEEEQEGDSLDEEQKDTYVEKYMPELLGLLSAYLDLERQQKQIKKIQNIIKDQYLDIKQKAIKQYQMDILFYIMIKKKNNDVRDHPIIQSLVLKKQQLDKINEIGLSYQKQLEQKYKQYMKELKQNRNENQNIQEELLLTDKLIKHKIQKHKEQNDKVNEDQLKEIYDNIYDEEEENRFNINDRDSSNSHSYDEDSYNSDMEQDLQSNQKEQQQKKQNLQFYEDVQQQKSKIKQTIQQQRQDADDQYFRQMGHNEVKDDEGRKVTYEILKNKGLTRNRRKDQRNARVKHKERYRKAIVKQKSLQNYVRVNKGGYGGEKTGIKSNIIKSTNLKKNN